MSTMVVKKAESFTIDEPKVNPAGGAPANLDQVRQAAIMMRQNLMKFPNARSVENKKIDGKTAIVVSVKNRGDKIELPKDLEYMNLTEEATGDNLAVYQLKEGGYKVYIKKFKIKVSSMSPNKNKINPVSPIKWTKKRKRTIAPAEGSPSKWPVSGFKLPRSKNVAVAKAEKLVVECGAVEKAEKKTKDAAKNKVKRAAIDNRGKLMKFPGARRVRCQKTSKGEYQVVVYVKSMPSTLPTVDGFQKVDGGYKLQGCDYKIVLKQKKEKVNVLRKTKKWQVAPVTGKKYVKKSKPAVKPSPAPDTPTEITGGCKLVPEPVVKRNWSAFFVDMNEVKTDNEQKMDTEETKKKDSKNETPRMKIKKIANEKRTKLMSFPGARRITCQKVANDYVVNLYVKKGTLVPVKKDQGFMDLKKGPGFYPTYGGYASYLLKDSPVTVVIKENPSPKIKALRRSKMKPGKVSRKKWAPKDKPTEMPKAAPGTEADQWPGSESKLIKRE